MRYKKSIQSMQMKGSPLQSDFQKFASPTKSVRFNSSMNITRIFHKKDTPKSIFRDFKGRVVVNLAETKPILKIAAV